MTTRRKTNSKRTRTPILPARRPAPSTPPSALSSRRSKTAGSCGNIAGDVYQDNNANGAEDAGEPYLAGFSIYIDANHNGQLDQGETSVKSNNLGKYAFSNLPAGTYTLSEQTQAGYTLTQPAGGRRRDYRRRAKRRSGLWQRSHLPGRHHPRQYLQ